jgi:F-type H+-transporting ATPase subunit a
MRILLLSIAFLFSCSVVAIAQDHNDHEGHEHHDHSQQEATHDDHAGHDHADHEGHDHDDHSACACGHEEDEFLVAPTAFHHIGDANSFHVWGDIYIPLPCILYSADNGWNTFMSSKFHPHHHGNGELAIDRYVLAHGAVMRIADPSFPMGEQKLECVTQMEHGDESHAVVMYDGVCYELEGKSTLDYGVFGGGFTSYYDFSITKNVFTMVIVLLGLFLFFRSIAKAYGKRKGMAPKGAQGFMEPIILFIQDEVAKPFLGDKYDKYLPFLLSIFFFILGLNLIGQIPFFPGSANVTGNLGVTFVLAMFTFFVVNLNGNRHYWEHIFWMPGVPAWVKTIVTPVEFLGLFIKPFTLMLRLFANITAGHIVLVAFVGLIFIFGESGKSVGGASLGAATAVPLTMFMMAIELLVAVIQAFVFTLLTASYIGAAIEEHHYDHVDEHYHPPT